MSNYRPFLIIGLVLAIVIIGGLLLFRSERQRDSLSPGSSAGLIAGQSPKAPEGVVVTLEEFGDYQCPPCGALHPSLKQLKKELGPNLNFVFRNLPLTSIHKNAMAAAQAAEAARMQDHFWEMHDLLYENQDLWKDDINPKTIFLKFAADLGLDTTRFTQDLDNEQVKLRIEADREAAHNLGIEGTPTILINGRELRPEVTTPEGIRKGIEVMLNRKSTPNP
jgi:protein-disulfide isomerase